MNYGFIITCRKTFICFYNAGGPEIKKFGMAHLLCGGFGDVRLILWRKCSWDRRDGAVLCGELLAFAL